MCRRSWTRPNRAMPVLRKNSVRHAVLAGKLAFALKSILSHDPGCGTLRVMRRLDPFLHLSFTVVGLLVDAFRLMGTGFRSRAAARSPLGWPGRGRARFLHKLWKFPLTFCKYYAQQNESLASDKCLNSSKFSAYFNPFQPILAFADTPPTHRTCVTVQSLCEICKVRAKGRLAPAQNRVNLRAFSIGRIPSRPSAEQIPSTAPAQFLLVSVIS